MCDGEPFSIDDRGRKLDSGCQYRTDAFLFPITFEPDRYGWQSFAVTQENAVFVGYDDTDDGVPEADLAILARDVDLAPEAVLVELLSIAGVDRRSGPNDFEIGTFSGQSIDVVTTEDQTAPGASPCTEPRSLRFYGDEPGWVLVESVRAGGAPQFSYGLPACHTIRVWALATPVGTLTILGTTRDLSRFDDLMPVLETLLATATRFEVP